MNELKTSNFTIQLGTKPVELSMLCGYPIQEWLDALKILRDLTGAEGPLECAESAMTIVHALEGDLVRARIDPADEFTESVERTVLHATSGPVATVQIVHGVNCVKTVHEVDNRDYLHARDDDQPYDVDGVTYCGRCHTYLEPTGASSRT